MDEDLLLGEPDTPEMVQKRVFSILELLAEGQNIDLLTEKDVKDVEETLNRIHKNLHQAKKTVLSEDDILMTNMRKLSVLSQDPDPQEKMSSRIPSISSLEELDYEESLEGSSEDEDELRIVTGSERESMERALKPVKRKCSGRKTPEDVIVLSSDSEYESESPKPLKRKKIKVEEVDEPEDSNVSRESPKPLKRNKIKVEEVDEDEDLNVSRAEFLKKLSDEEPYLKLRKSKMMASSDKTGLTYPLGVTFDKPSETWFITNSPYQSKGPGFAGVSKVLKIYVGKDKNRQKYTDIEDELLENPSAITVYKEGTQIAVLCVNKMKKPAIRLINFKRGDKITNFCSWKSAELDFEYEARGLARTKGGNLVTTDRPFEMCPRLRLFSKTSVVKQKTFKLREADTPCFIASSDDTVIITDLGKQMVMLIHLDDTDWDNVKFEIRKIVTAIGVNFHAEEMLNNQYFIYVSGAQIDKFGNIIIADAKNHHFKLFKPGMSFVSRISTDFPVPYVSSFHVNQHGECLILSTRETQKIHFAKLTSTNRLERHIKSGCGARIGVKTPLSMKRLTYRDGL